MNGLETMGMLFCTLLGIGVAFVVIWVICSVWRYGDEIQTLEAKVRMIEDVLREQKTKRQK
jgi:uncharacterized membrane protein YccC